jgi:hypothetical protein
MPYLATWRRVGRKRKYDCYPPTGWERHFWAVLARHWREVSFLVGTGAMYIMVTLWVQVLCTLWWPCGYRCYVHYGDFTLKELDYIVIISFGYILYCVCFNLYCGGFQLFCNVCGCGWLGGWVGFVMCGCLVWPPLWSSGQSFWLQIQRSRVRFQIFWVVVGLERDPLNLVSLVRSIEELLE